MLSYRYLFSQLVRRELRQKYKGSVLGIVWYLVNPVVLMVQRLDGGLTIGDTHSYAEPFDFDLDEDSYDHLRAKAESLLGTALPPTRRRWAGVYSQVTGGPELYFRSQVAPGVVLVTGPGGRGMTCAPAIAEQTFAV